MPDQGLGKQVAEFSMKDGWLIRAAGILLCILGFGGAIAAAAWGIWQAYQEYYLHGPAVILRSLVIPGLVVGLLFIAGISALRLAGLRQVAVTVFEDGLSVKEGKKVQKWNWEDLTSLRVTAERRQVPGLPAGNNQSYTLVWNDGQRLFLDRRIHQVERLAATIREKSLPILYARYSQLFESGQEMAFGPVLVGKASGVGIKNKMLTWDQVQKASIQKGLLSVIGKDKKGKSIKFIVPVEEVPNPEILLTLVDDCTGAESFS